MGYVLRAIIADRQLLAERLGLPAATLVGNLALVPMTEELHDRLTEPAGDRLGFHLLPAAFGATLSSWSAASPIAYVEAELFGGAGTQRAVVWDAGSVALGPIEHDTGLAPSFPALGSPISQALRRLGVIVPVTPSRAPTDRRQDHHPHRLMDEFAVAGLQRHRHTEDWLEEILRIVD
jgi:hypothetical protein